MIDNATELELTVLEDLLENDCNCEIKHITAECSIKVTHMITFCMGSALMCFNAAMGRSKAMKTTKCCECLRPASECWSIRPV